MADRDDKGHDKKNMIAPLRDKDMRLDDFVLEKSIFSNIFDKDIQRVFIYKKAERLAKALHLIAPAFVLSASLRNRLDGIAIGLVDAAILPPTSARDGLARELLALNSVLSIARTGGLLSSMNADLISREAQMLLQEIAAYEEPRLFFDEAPTLADIARRTTQSPREDKRQMARKEVKRTPSSPKGHLLDTPKTDRRDAILSVIRAKGRVYIKDLSVVIRGVSAKTIQRELALMLTEGTIRKEGERRWTSYSLA